MRTEGQGGGDKAKTKMRREGQGGGEKDEDEERRTGIRLERQR